MIFRVRKMANVSTSGSATKRTARALVNICRFMERVISFQLEIPYVLEIKIYPPGATRDVAIRSSVPIKEGLAQSRTPKKCVTSQVQTNVDGSTRFRLQISSIPICTGSFSVHTEDRILMSD